MSQKSQLFVKAPNQIVRMPSSNRFDTETVYIRKDSQAGEIISSSRPDNWDDFFSALNDVVVPDDFLDVNERQQIAQDRDPF